MFKRMRTIRFYMVVCLMGLSHWVFALGEYENNGCFIGGSENADVTIEEFADFECIYCAKGSQMMEQVLKEYGEKVKVVFRNRPLSSHRIALPAAKAMGAVCMQGSELAHTFQQEIFQNQEKLKKEGENFLFVTAEKIGVNVEQMKGDMNSQAVSDAIAQDQKRADELKITGTPGFKVGTEVLVGSRPFEEFKQVIDRQLHK